MRNAADFLPSQSICQLTQRIALHQRLLVEAQRVLPSYLRTHCQACWLNQRGQLILQVSGQEYAAQIRFFLTAILDAVKKIAGEGVVQVQIKTALTKTASVASRIAISPNTAQLIANEAYSSSVPEIGNALRRLACSMAKHNNKEKKQNCVD